MSDGSILKGPDTEKVYARYVGEIDIIDEMLTLGIFDDAEDPDEEKESD